MIFLKKRMKLDHSRRISNGVIGFRFLLEALYIPHFDLTNFALAASFPIQIPYLLSSYMTQNKNFTIQLLVFG